MRPNRYSEFKPATLALAINAVFVTGLTAQAAETPSASLQPSQYSTSLSSVTLPTITVIAESEKSDGAVQGIAASTVSSTTGFDESILKSTQSVTVVGQQEIESTGASDVIEALEYSAGVNKTDESNIIEGYMVRGFESREAFRDGQRYHTYVYGGQQEIYGLDRIELSKGPASVLNGALPPGGMINAISKKPKFTDDYEVNIEAGSFNRKQVATDLNHQINDELAVRLVGLYRDSDTFIDYVADDRTYVAPSLKWQPTPSTSVTFQGEYQKDLTQYVPGLPYRLTNKTNPNGKVPRNRFAGTPSFDQFDNKRSALGYSIEHEVTPNLQLKHHLRRTKTDLYFPWSGLSADSDTTKTVLSRRLVDRKTDSEQLVSGVTGIYDWSVGDNIDNVTLMGVDYARRQIESRDKTGTASAIDLINPDYANETISDNFIPSFFSYQTDNDQIGLFLQNQMTLNDRWVGVVGLRHDKANLENTSLATEAVQDSDFAVTTGRLGLVYLMDNGVAPYASINQSFEVNLGIDRNGDNFEPTEGIQYEVGARYQPTGSDTLLSGSIYQIDQTNVLVNDPVVPGVQAQLGKVRSKGFELEAKTQIGDNANLLAAYAYTDARTIKSSPTTPELEGKRSGAVPYNKVAIWGDYRFSDFNLPQLKVGAGLRYQDNGVNDTNDVEYFGYTLMDAMVSYDWDEHWSLALNVKNLLDEEYVICQYKCNYGESRNIVGKVTYQW